MVPMPWPAMAAAAWTSNTSPPVTGLTRTSATQRRTTSEGGGKRVRPGNQRNCSTAWRASSGVLGGDTRRGLVTTAKNSASICGKTHSPAPESLAWSRRAREAACWGALGNRAKTRALVSTRYRSAGIVVKLPTVERRQHRAFPPRQVRWRGAGPGPRELLPECLDQLGDALGDRLGEGREGDGGGLDGAARCSQRIRIAQGIPPRGPLS